jgi:hypothetical protein
LRIFLGGKGVNIISNCQPQNNGAGSGRLLIKELNNRLIYTYRLFSRDITGILFENE